MRGETPDAQRCYSRRNISIHSPHAGRDAGKPTLCTLTTISIHSPHAGRDLALAVNHISYTHFNPLSPCGERLHEVSFVDVTEVISIHSPHAGRDEQGGILKILDSKFQSTLPMRGETQMRNVVTVGEIFQSTLPMRGETAKLTALLQVSPISIHSPHAGRDPQKMEK